MPPALQVPPFGDGDVPQFPPEEHRCLTCGLDYSAIEVERALTMINTATRQTATTVLDLSDGMLRSRPIPDRWSILEYLCHLRDVYATYTLRLHRSRVELEPRLEPMYNDLRALRFGYNELSPALILEELDHNAAGVRAEVELMAPGDWERTVRRRDGEVRTARWLLRQVAHEGRHHLLDIRRLLPE